MRRCEICGDEIPNEKLEYYMPCLTCGRSLTLCHYCWRYRSGATDRGKRPVYCENGCSQQS